MTDRIEVIRSRAAALSADAALLTRLTDIRWAAGFSGSNGVLLVTMEGAYFLTDGRYEIQANEEIDGAQVLLPGYKLYEHIAEQSLLPDNCTCIVQADDLSISTYEHIQDLQPSVTLQPVKEFLVKDVARKSEDEIEQIRAAQQITDAVYRHLLGVIEPDISELDLAAEIVYQHLKRGCEKMAFEPIVASGPRSALPHARPTTRKLKKGEVLLIDMGGVKNGYASDMTRTLAIGEPGERVRTVYQIVLNAQEAALEAAQAGMTAKNLDAEARSVIDNSGYGAAFSHSLGHGIGLQTHEWPSVSSRSDAELLENTVISIEPGIYLEGRFGIRIEDLIVLKRSGSLNLTKSRKDLVVI